MINPASLLSGLLDLFYPDLCGTCRQRTALRPEGICTHCLMSLSRTNFHLQAINPITSIFTGRVQVTSATAFLYFEKHGLTQHLLHLLKYRNAPETGRLLGRIAGKDLMEGSFLEDIDVMIPVPLHPDKLKLRGYNQSDWIGMGLNEVTGIPLSRDMLLRSTYNESQTRKSRYERYENVLGIFEIPDPDLLTGKHILLVDDVITTGSTLESCISRLLEVPETRVSVFCMAFAP